MKKAKKLLYLFSVFFISIFVQVIFFQILAFYNLVNLITWITIMILLFLVLFPLAAFFYSKAFIPRNNKKWLKSVICPAVLALSYLILYFREDETYGIALILFAWCEIWSLIGMKGSQKNKNK